MTQPKSLEEESAHALAVGSRVEAAVRSGFTELNDVLRACEGADPRLVASILKEQTHLPSSRKGSLASLLRDPLGSLSRPLPAPDPFRSQWWFSSEGLSHLLGTIDTRASLFDQAKILCLGTPSLAPYISTRDYDVSILDVDNQVLGAISPLSSRATILEHDVSDPIPTTLARAFNIAVLDPPWYPEAIYTFLNRALSALELGGEILCTLPGRLTRPGVEQFRAELVRDLVEAQHQILSLDRESVRYQVPRFELAALADLEGFRGIPWRAGDLLHFRKTSERCLPEKAFAKCVTQTFSRNPTEYRIFSRGTAQAGQGVILRQLPNYSRKVSTRGHPDENADIWSTEKVGIQVGNFEPIRAALEGWSSGLDQQRTAELLAKNGHHKNFAEDVVERIGNAFDLWTRFAAQPPLRLQAELEAARNAVLSKWATPPNEREHSEPSDAFRGPYQRDRDRILWSSGLRRLSNKTQLFPVEYDDDLRQRLAHSIEVSQLASTIGTSFGLDGDLIEGGSLAHDIGHTPFGHAGESALDKLLNQINPDLGGFNHYEHGVDVIRFLEGPYHVSASTKFSGLNLTPELCECVLKHTYCHNGEGFTSEAILANSKHRGFILPGYCHLEGQAVRIADKVSYLISDIEDGIRLGILTNADLLQCSFFHRPPLDFSATESRSLYEQFLEQRRFVLKILMEDILQATNKRLARLPGQKPSIIRSTPEYVVQYSDDMLRDVEEIWALLQTGRLHKDRRVVTANLHAARIVAELTIVFSLLPHLIDDQFRSEHERLSTTDYMGFYRRAGKRVTLPAELVSFLPIHRMVGTKHVVGAAVSVPIEELVMAKDYVAALSDSRARSFHRTIVDGH